MNPALRSLAEPLALGFAVAALAVVAILAVARRLDVRQHAYEYAPQSHQRKTGTPTMGGLAFVAALIALFVAGVAPLARDLILLVVACAGIGALDDVLAMRSGRNRGLRARTKLLATALVAVMFLRAIGDSTSIFPRDVIFHGAGIWLAVPHWLWFLLASCAIVGTIHAVNLTDGLDGLATGTMIPPLLLFGTIGLRGALPAASDAAFTGAGACAAFLLFNRYPAKIFMGDTGSLALGALLSGAAILTGELLLLLLAGAVFVAEALSVIVQVSYFRATGGKRILRMSPLHHHFEMLEWPETKVTMRFWLASAIASLLGWAIVR